MKYTYTYGTKHGRLLVLSMLIGDGCLEKEGRLHVLHCKDQLPYLQWKKSLLEANGIEVNPIHYRKNILNNIEYGAYYFRTKHYKFMDKYRSIIYNPIKKYWFKSYLNNLTPESIAIWYMDDGHIHIDKYSSSTLRNQSVELSTYLNYDETLILIDYFKNKWNIEFKPMKDTGRNDNRYYIYTNVTNCHKFLDIVRPTVSKVSSMIYKLGV